MKLDKNGYAPTIVGTGEECFLCLCTPPQLVRHEIFHGEAFRDKSKELGLWCTLCPECHRITHFVDKRKDRYLKHVGYINATSHYGWTDDEFRKHFGKIYITEQEEN